MCDLLVTGASGFLGAHMMRVCAASGRDVLGIVHHHPMPVEARSVCLDMADSSALVDLVRAERPKAIIHAGALTAPDYCELHPAEATAINLTASGILAMAAFAVNAHMVFISTDLVFDGERGMYSESDPPSPINHYARTKAEAERLIHATSSAFAIVRPSFIYGEPMAEHQSSFSHGVLDNLRYGKDTPVFYDQYRSPIEAGVLAKAVLEVSDRRLGGFWHIAGPERVNRVQFARLLAEVAGMDPSPLREVSMDDVSLPAPRPRDASLSTIKARSGLNTCLQDLRSSFEALYRSAT